MIKYRGLEELVFGPTHEGDAKIAYDGVHYTMRTPAGKGLGLSFTAAPVAYGGGQSFIEIGGDTASPLEVAIDDYWFPIRASIKNTKNPAGQKMFAFARFWYEQSTEEQDNLNTCGIQTILNLTRDTGWAKTLDAGIVIDSEMACKGGASIMAVVNAGLVKNAVATANVITCGYFGVYGTESEVGGRGASVLYLNVSTGASIPAGIIFDIVGTMTDMIKVPFAGAITHVLNFTETDGSTGAKTGATIANDKAADGCLKIKVGDTVYYIPYFAADDVSGSW